MNAPYEQKLPEAQVRKRSRRPSIVWVIPLVAALAGAWLLYDHWSKQGPILTVSFPNAEGIQAGKTEVRYKAVTVGKVVDVHLDDTLNPVVKIQMSKSMGDKLQCSARFWVVRARVRGAEISGLGTLFSGTYIGMIPNLDGVMDPGGAKEPCHQALEEPPPSRPEGPGRTYVLTTDTLGSLGIGAPIYYKQLQVGEIINYRLSQDTGKILLEAWVRAPYHSFVRRNTRFWNASGMEFKMGASGAELRVESLASLLVGGVGFDTPPSAEPSEESPADEMFVLHPDYASTRVKKYTERLYYTMYFTGSLRGLTVGAPVEFQGIPVGRVENIEMKLDTQTLGMEIPVVVAIEPRRFSNQLEIGDAPRLMRQMVKRGMRAKLQNVSLLTGQMIIALSMERRSEPATIQKADPFPIFPTTPTAVDQLSRMAVEVATDLKRSLAAIRRFVEGDDIKDSIDNLNKVFDEAQSTVKEARLLLGAVGTKTLPGLEGEMSGVADNVKVTLDKVRGSLVELDRMLSRNSPARHKMDKLVDELTGAARGFRLLTEELKRQPESLIRGRREPQK